MAAITPGTNKDSSTVCRIRVSAGREAFRDMCGTAFPQKKKIKLPNGSSKKVI